MSAIEVRRMQLVIGTAFAALFLILATLAVASAQETIPSGEVDFAPVVAQAFQYLAVGLGVGAVWVVGRVSYFAHQWFNVQLDEVARQRIVEAIQPALNWAKKQAVDLAAAQDLTWDVKNIQIAHAINYMLTRLPDSVDRLGLSPEDLEQLLESRLGLKDPVTSPEAIAAST